jgi:hypothetical protein
MRLTRRCAVNASSLPCCISSPLPLMLCCFPSPLLCCLSSSVSGRNFGSYVTHETKNFIYFYLGQVAILLFKSG